MLVTRKTSSQRTGLQHSILLLCRLLVHVTVISCLEWIKGSLIYGKDQPINFEIVKGIRIAGMATKDDEYRLSSHKWNKYDFARLGYGLDHITYSKYASIRPALTFTPFPKFETTLTYTGWGLPLKMRFPTVTAASPDVTQDDTIQESRGFLGDLFRSHDDVNRTVMSRSMFAPIPGETGWDRLRTMYSKDQLGNLGPEWQHIIQGLYVGFISGSVIGFFLGGRSAADSFVARNEGTKFLNEVAARRALQDKMTLGMANYAWKWGWRMTAFTSIYLYTAANLSVYRGRSSAFDYMAAGGVTGVFWKFLQGPRAMLVAGTLGSILGLIAGAIALTILRAGGMTMEEMRYWHYQTGLLQQGEVIGKVMPPVLDSKGKKESSDDINRVTITKEKEV